MRRDVQTTILVLLLAAHAFAADQEKTVPGAVELNNGVRYEGPIELYHGRLSLFVPAHRKQYSIYIDEIRSIEQIVTRAELADKWVFKEEGRREKIKSGEKYPVMEFRTKVTFHDGKTLEGDLIATTIWVRTGGERRRFNLYHKIEMVNAKSLDEIEYVKLVEFARSGEGTRGTISGRLSVPAGQKLEALWAINADRGFSLPAKMGRDGRSFKVDDVTSGAYDLVAVTDQAIFLWLSLETRPQCRRFSAEDLKDIWDWLKLLDEFFDVQQPVYAAGNEKRAIVLIMNERHGKMHTGEQLLRRYDLFVMSKPDKWKIDKRIFLTRRMNETQDAPPLTVVVDRRMGGIQVNRETPDPTRDIELSVPSGAAPGAVVDAAREADHGSR